MNKTSDRAAVTSCTDPAQPIGDGMPANALAAVEGVLHADRAGARCTPSDCRAILAAAREAHPLVGDPAALERRARAFRALADTTRLRILALLLLRELCLCEIVDALQVAESTLVHHLRMLEEGGMVAARREGKFTYFRVAPTALEQYRPLDQEPRTAAPRPVAHRP